jgi:hypothetical protein
MWTCGLIQTFRELIPPSSYALKMEAAFSSSILVCIYLQIHMQLRHRGTNSTSSCREILRSPSYNTFIWATSLHKWNKCLALKKSLIWSSSFIAIPHNVTLGSFRAKSCPCLYDWRVVTSSASYGHNMKRRLAVTNTAQSYTLRGLHLTFNLLHVRRPRVSSSPIPICPLYLLYSDLGLMSRQMTSSILVLVGN